MHNISKELREESDVDVADASSVTSSGEVYIKEGGSTDKMTVVYKVVLREAKDEFLAEYHQFVQVLKLQYEIVEGSLRIWTDWMRAQSFGVTCSYFAYFS